jgi:hypothetical protein
MQRDLIRSVRVGLRHPRQPDPGAFLIGPAGLLAPRSLRAAPLSPRARWDYCLTECRVQVPSTQATSLV